MPTAFLLLLAYTAVSAQTFILIGPPGSGKSVQAAQLSKLYKIPAISMQSLLKQEIGRKTPRGKALASSIASGDLVNDDASNELIKARLLQPDAGRGFILDGYPVTEVQAKALDRFIADQGFPKPIVLVLEAPDAVLRQRMRSRKRADDSPAIIERRLTEYRELGALTEKWYGSDSLVRVDGTRPVASVTAELSRQVDQVRSKKGFATR